MVKKPETKTNQLMLTATFLIVMLLSFVAVAVVQFQYESTRENILFMKSDTNLNFGSVVYADTLTFSDTFSIQNAQHLNSIENPYTQINKTISYSGNNTWSIGVNDFGVLDTGITINDVLIIIELPNIKNVAIDYINITSTFGSQSTSVFAVSIAHFTNDIWPQGISTTIPSSEPISYQEVIDTTLTTELEHQFDLSTLDSLNTIEKSNQHGKSYLIIEISTEPNLMNNYAWDLSFEMYGEQITGWSLNDSVNSVKVIFGTLLFIIGTFMLDGVDVGKTVKDLKQRRR